MMITFALVAVVLVILFTTRQNEKLKEVNERYKKLRQHLEETNNEKFHMLTRHIPITGKLWMSNTVGSNTNKGGEIVVCLDGEVNEIFHVLIHELAHCTVKEYDHSAEFWKNYEELRDICVSIGVYDRVLDKTEFCGQHVQDR
jgi:predicted metal-dependent hydrolase